MSASPDIARVPGTFVLEAASTVSGSFNPTAISWPEGRPAVRLLKQLTLHRALDELGWTGAMDEFNDAVRLRYGSVPEPILITTKGTILAGYGRWRLAVFEGRQEIQCIEYALGEDESLQFILSYHQSRRGWNAFVCIRLALTQEPLLQQRALDNMRAGGKYKGSANLPDLQRIDVRQEIANLANVGARNVSNVKTILEVAHPRLIAALRDGRLTINGAMRFCKLPQAEQLERFTLISEERTTERVIRRAIARPKGLKTSLDVATVLDALQRQEERQPGSVAVQVSRFPRTVVLVGHDLLAGPYAQKELEPK